MEKKKIQCIFYLVDDYLYLYNLKKNNLKEYKFTNYIYEGRIIKPKILIKKINEILKTEKLSKILSSQNTIIIYNSNLKYIDKKIIIDSFTECNFKNIKLVNSKDLLNKRKNYIEVNNNYIIAYIKNKYTFIRLNDYFNQEFIIELLTKKIDDSILLLGINNNISNLSNLNNKLYYLENSNSYYIDIIIKKIKN